MTGTTARRTVATIGATVALTAVSALAGAPAQADAWTVPTGPNAWSENVRMQTLHCPVIFTGHRVVSVARGPVVRVDPDRHRTPWVPVRVIHDEGTGAWDAAYSQRGVSRAVRYAVCTTTSAYYRYIPERYAAREYHRGLACVPGLDGRAGCWPYATRPTAWR